MVSGRDLSRGALTGVFYDEHVRDNWGFSLSIGIWTSFFVTAQIELGYHWSPGRVEVRGTSGGLPFRRVEKERNEWLYICLSFGF